MKCTHFVLCEDVERDPSTRQVLRAITPNPTLRTRRGHGTLKRARTWARLIGDSSKFTELFLTLGGPIPPDPVTGDTSIRDFDSGGPKIPSVKLSQHSTVREEPAEPFDFVANIAPIFFPSFGRYVILLWADDTCIAETSVVVEPR